MADETRLKASELAILMEVELKTIHNWFDEGKLPGFRSPGGHLSFLPAEVVQRWNDSKWRLPPRFAAWLTDQTPMKPVPTYYLRRATTDALLAELASRGVVVQGQRAEASS